MTFPSNDLERALQQAEAGDLSVEAFARTLLTSTVLVPVRREESGGVTLPTVTHEGAVLLPVFTSREQAEKAAPQQQEWAAPPVAEILEQLPDDVGLAVNIGGDVGLPVSRALLIQAEGGAITVPAGARVRIGEPAVEPVQLLKVIGEELSAVPAARSARRAWAQVDQSAPGLVVGVEIDPDNPDTRRSVLEAVNAAVARYAERPEQAVTEALGAVFPVDVVFTSERDSLVDWMQANTDPFHEAGRG